MKHTIKTTCGKYMVLEILTNQKFAFIELHGVSGDSYVDVMDVEQLQCLVIAAQSLISRMNAVHEGKKRNKEMGQA
jgi:hypothetical protein